MKHSSVLGHKYRIVGIDLCNCLYCSGAEWIYDTDDDNEPLSLDLPLHNTLLEMEMNKGPTTPQLTSNIYKQVSWKVIKFNTLSPPPT